MIHNIQILRGFAALSVVFAHITGISASYNMPVIFFKPLEGWGAFGVDIFFVISGFIMMHIQYRSPKSTFSFIKSRIIRIVPLYWLLTSSLVILLVLIPGLFREAQFSIEHTLSSFLFFTHFISSEYPYLAVGWTLEWEMMFYVFFAIAISFRNSVLGAFFVVVSLSIIGVYFDQLLVIEFAFGMIIAYIYETKPIKAYWGQTLFLMGFMILILWLFYDPLHELDRLFSWGIPSAMIVFGSLYLKQIQNRILKYLGDASYSIYLIQIFTIPVFYKLIVSIKLGEQFGDIFAVLCLLFSTIVGAIVYSFIERPSTLFFRHIFLSPSKNK